jgi:hypothetical protein
VDQEEEAELICYYYYYWDTEECGWLLGGGVDKS